MRKVLLYAVIVLLFAQCDTATTDENDTSTEEVITQNVDSEDQKAIKAVLEAAYINGTQIDGDSAAIRKGFHENFMMFVSGDEGRVNQVSREDWITRIEARKIEQPNQPKPNITFEVPMVDVTGSAAIAKVEVAKDSKHIFTDYMSFYKKEGKWMLVGKIYERH